MWIYVQRTGVMFRDVDGPTQPLARGYSGWGAAENNPAEQCNEAHGPLPQGRYTFGKPIEYNNMADCLRLTPDPGNAMCGRDGFLVHDGVWHGPHGRSSLGCICLPQAARLTIWHSGDHTLQVVAETPTENAVAQPVFMSTVAEDMSNASRVSDSLLVQAQPGTVQYGSLVIGGVFSADPADLSVRRSIRTNNPGALDITDWQKSRPGYIGFTQPDNSRDNNRTTIYRTPEHGVAAWYHLISSIYGFAPGTAFTLADLASKYAGSHAKAEKISGYVKGWTAKSNGRLPATLDLRVDGLPLMLARAMFALEAGQPSPLLDLQITAAISWEYHGVLPP